MHSTSERCWRILSTKKNESEMSDSLQPHGLSRLPSPWDFPGKSTGVGCHCLLQGIFPTQGWNPGLLYYRQSLYCLSHQGSPMCWLHWYKAHLTKMVEFTLLALLLQSLETIIYLVSSFSAFFQQPHIHEGKLFSLVGYSTPTAQG